MAIGTTTLNPGTGGDKVLNDSLTTVNGGAAPSGAVAQVIKQAYGAASDANLVDDTHGMPSLLLGAAAGTWPGYSGPSDTAQRTATIDDDGALITRSAVLTDEGTFRCNFANTSLWVGIGSVTVSGTTVGGTGFLAADVNLNDYFKVSADADTVAVQIASIDSDTQLTLKAAYTGSTSGTGQRAIMLPVTGAGGSNAVASGQLTIIAGTTATSQTGVKRYVDYGPLVYRARGTISQRIANQALRAGFREDVATPRWFAWFLLDGTTNTTVKLQTGRNPTGAPSASEIQETTVTLPNGATTATARDWRIELLNERVVFYCDDVHLFSHSITIPHQHDEMAAVYEFVNGTTPASSTTAVVDFCTVKNHNKVEIGVMSDTEKIVASQPPAQEFFYSQAGVIAINTNLLVIDCSQIRSLSIQVVSMGTTGIITPEWSNDPAFGSPLAGAAVSATAGAGPATTFSTAGIWTSAVPARYLRLRLSTATTAGTTTLRVVGFQHAAPYAINTAVTGIAGTVTVAAAAGTARIGNVSGAGIWYDDSSTALAANATFTGTNRDATVTATATAFANAATYAGEIRVSAESDQSGTLWIEVSRDNTNWRRAKSVPTAAVTGGGQYAEIIHRPSWRYWRVGFTNGATLQARFSIGSIATATA